MAKEQTDSMINVWGTLFSFKKMHPSAFLIVLKTSHKSYKMVSLAERQTCSMKTGKLANSDWTMCKKVRTATFCVSLNLLV